MNLKKIVCFSSALLMLMGVGASASQTPANARHVRKHRTYRHHRFHLGIGFTVRLKKPVRVSYIRMENIAAYDHPVHAKWLPKGTVLHGFPKGTEGVIDLVYGCHVHITRRTWPSVWLTSRNCRVLHNYKYHYGYMYTMKHVLHYKDV